MKGKVFKSIMLVLSLMLVLAGGANAQGGETVVPIPPGPETSLPDYIGQPAKAHPLPNSGVPQNPYFAPNPFSLAHSDIWMSDTADLAGPLGRKPVVSSTSLAGVKRDSWIASGGNMAFDSHGRPVVFLFSNDWASVALLDPDTLDVVSSYPLKARVGIGGEGAQQTPFSAWSIYAYLDNRDQIHIVSESKYLLTLAETGSLDHPVLKEVREERYDLSQLVGTTERVTGVVMDFQGRYWINLGTSSMIYLLNPKTAPAEIEDLPHVLLDIDGDGDEKTRNGTALTREGAAYIVTTEAMYRVDADADDRLSIVWQVPYDSIDSVRPGQYELGSGTTPTILGEGKYVAITDNAEQLQVVVYRTAPDEELEPDQQRVVCEVPVFDFPEGGAGAGSNSLVGLHNSIIAQNTADYLFDWESGTLTTPGKPGMARIDIDPNGKGCTKVWVNTEVHTNMVMKLSTRNGLIYTQDRKYDAVNDVYAVYWVALDFRTGEVVWEQLAGTFARTGSATFDNFWAAIGLGPNGALYGANYGGVTMLRDGK
jgi:hypothetical protein